MSLTDPRNTSDLFSAPGDFTTVDQSGDVQPLKTYGILRIKVQGEDNETLDVAGNMKIYLDADKVITWNFFRKKNYYVDQGDKPPSALLKIIKALLYLKKARALTRNMISAIKTYTIFLTS